ncbi:putative style cell-cycle inhibitor 1 [Helianthus debilis subsp. tardiflorus]
MGKSKKRRSPAAASEDEPRSSHKKHKDSRKSSNGKPEEKHRHKHKRHKRDRPEISNFKELSDADYFLKNNEFATWLKDKRDTFFSDLSSESARKLFSEFVKAWNKKKLDSRYYDGIVTAPRSSHNWKIKSDAEGT